MIGKRQAKLNFLFPSSLQAEFTSVLCVCFGRRSFELVRAASYLWKPRRKRELARSFPRRILSSTKIN